MPFHSSSLQQTAASMEQLAGTVTQSAESARRVNQLAQSASAAPAVAPAGTGSDEGTRF